MDKPNSGNISTTLYESQSEKLDTIIINGTIGSEQQNGNINRKFGFLREL